MFARPERGDVMALIVKAAKGGELRPLLPEQHLDLRHHFAGAAGAHPCWGKGCRLQFRTGSEQPDCVERLRTHAPR
jgi:hypothetical protein